MSPNGNGQESTVRLTQFFSAQDILCHTSQTYRDAVIMELLTQLAMNRGIGNVKEAFDAIIERETVFPSCIADGIAMPHARLSSINELTISICTSTEGITFEEAKPKNVKVIVLVLAPRDQPALYLQTASLLARIFGAEDAIRTVAGFSNPEDVWRYLERGGVELPPYVVARDIMRPNPVALLETHTLADAIDYFVKYNLLDVPVVDADGDIVGVVSAYELLRVCLPDYILWIDDISPIINFEPFANVLRSERNTWLAEIMSQEFVVVSQDAPAAQVAKEITKQAARAAYVVEGHHLVGVITLQQFLNKVLRE